MAEEDPQADVSALLIKRDGQRLKREREELSQIFTSWNQLDGWLRQIEGLRRVA